MFSIAMARDQPLGMVIEAWPSDDECRIALELEVLEERCRL